MRVDYTFAVRESEKCIFDGPFKVKVSKEYPEFEYLDISLMRIEAVGTKEEILKKVCRSFANALLYAESGPPDSQQVDQLINSIFNSK